MVVRPFLWVDNIEKMIIFARTPEESKVKLLLLLEHFYSDITYFKLEWDENHNYGRVYDFGGEF